MNQARVLARPTESCSGGEGSLDHRPGIDVSTRFECAKRFMHALFECTQALQQDFVVVGWTAYAVGIDSTRPCIARDPSSVRIGGCGRSRMSRVVIGEADNGGTCPRKRRSDARTHKLLLFVGALQPGHAAGMPGLDPSFETRGITRLVTVGQGHKASFAEACTAGE